MSAPAGPAFSGMVLDRAATLRHDPDWMAGVLSAPGSHAVLAGRDGVVLDDTGTALLRVPFEPGPDPLGEPIILGLEGGAALVASDLDGLDPARAAAQAGGRASVGLREAAAILSHAEAGLAAYLMALLNWHRTNRFCANCGAPSAIAEGGYSRRCPRCQTVHFPRTDPVAIMLVESEDRLLLGRRAGWPTNRYSVLAGFVSPGESAEEAVVREVREESGIEARDPAFVASQPWPFPSSLMLGFEARSDDSEPEARDGELEDVRWFHRDTVRSAALAPGPGLALPPPISIARFLIDRWLLRP